MTDSYIDGGTLICFYKDGNYDQAITEALETHGLEREKVQIICKPEPDMIDRLWMERGKYANGQ
jgi:hypothetical protein